MFLSWKNTDEADLEGRTAFMWAAGKGADNVLRVFFHHRVDVQQEDKTGGTGKNHFFCPNQFWTSASNECKLVLNLIKFTYRYIYIFLLCVIVPVRILFKETGCLPRGEPAVNESNKQKLDESFIFHLPL